MSLCTLQIWPSVTLASLAKWARWGPVVGEDDYFAHVYPSMISRSLGAETELSRLMIAKIWETFAMGFGAGGGIRSGAPLALSIFSLLSFPHSLAWLRIASHPIAATKRGAVAVPEGFGVLGYDERAWAGGTRRDPCRHSTSLYRSERDQIGRAKGKAGCRKSYGAQCIIVARRLRYHDNLVKEKFPLSYPQGQKAFPTFLSSLGQGWRGGGNHEDERRWSVEETRSSHVAPLCRRR